jgi:hypothetical protein
VILFSFIVSELPSLLMIRVGGTGIHSTVQADTKARGIVMVKDCRYDNWIKEVRNVTARKRRAVSEDQNFCCDDRALALFLVNSLLDGSVLGPNRDMIDYQSLVQMYLL